MCTVSIVPMRCEPAGSGIRLACNRDESRQRPPARLPEIRLFNQRRAIMPVDPVSDGTWIGVNDAGLVMTLMNVYPAPVDREGFAAWGGRYASRGAIIPSLLHCESIDEAVSLAGRLDPLAYPSFRLVLLDGTRLAEVVARSERLEVTPPALIAGPMMYASSGLGDERVISPRRELFDELLDDAADPAAAQDAFHRHRWPDRPHLSVCMSRPEARTVSLTVVEITPARCRLIYYPDSPDRAAEPAIQDLPVRDRSQRS